MKWWNWRWWHYLWPFGLRRERIEAERQVDEEFRAQLREAVLRQDDLREAAAYMKRTIEDKVELSTRSIRPPRDSLGSNPIV